MEENDIEEIMTFKFVQEAIKALEQLLEHMPELSQIKALCSLSTWLNLSVVKFTHSMNGVGLEESINSVLEGQKDALLAVIEMERKTK